MSTAMIRGAVGASVVTHTCSQPPETNPPRPPDDPHGRPQAHPVGRPTPPQRPGPSPQRWRTARGDSGSMHARPHRISSPGRHYRGSAATTTRRWPAHARPITSHRSPGRLIPGLRASPGLGCATRTGRGSALRPPRRAHPVPAPLQELGRRHRHLSAVDSPAGHREPVRTTRQLGRGQRLEDPAYRQDAQLVAPHRARRRERRLQGPARRHLAGPARPHDLPIAVAGQCRCRHHHGGTAPAPGAGRAGHHAPPRSGEHHRRRCPGHRRARHRHPRPGRAPLSRTQLRIDVEPHHRARRHRLGRGHERLRAQDIPARRPGHRAAADPRRPRLHHPRHALRGAQAEHAVPLVRRHPRHRNCSRPLAREAAPSSRFCAPPGAWR